jgi:hypothetical protein
VSALARMRLAGFVRTGRALAPLLGLLVVLGIMYGGGAAQAGEAYGFSAVVVFPVLAWQTQILLNAEPDIQRRLSIVAVGGLAREIGAGMLAAAAGAAVVLIMALITPWPIGGITGPQEPSDPALLSGIAAGVWAHALLVPPALVLGALASRAVARNAARGVAILTSGTVFGIVLGLKVSPVPWLVPPLMPTARSTVDGLAPGEMIVHTAHATLWTAVAAALYVIMRRRNV